MVARGVHGCRKTELAWGRANHLQAQITGKPATPLEISVELKKSFTAGTGEVAANGGRGDISRPRVAAIGQHLLRPLLCVKAREWAAVLAARNFAQRRAEALPIVEARRHGTNPPSTLNPLL